MTLVIDTNVIISGLMNGDSPPGILLDKAAAEDLHLIAPLPVLEELKRILCDKLRISPAETQRMVRALHIEWILPAEYAAFLDEAALAIHDPDDLPLVACALAFGSGVVSGDKAFHPLEKQVVPTWRPREHIGNTRDEQKR